MATVETVSISLLLLGAAISTYPAVRLLLDRWKPSSTQHVESQQAKYEDEDGQATQESLDQYRARCHPRFILTLVCFGIVLSSVSVILDTVTCRSLVLSMSHSGQWLSASFLAVAYMLERQPCQRFTLANSMSLSTSFILLGQIMSTFDRAWFSSSEDISILGVRRCLVILQCAAASAILLLCLSNPRRPRLIFRGAPVDDQYSVSLSQRLSFAWISPILRHARSGFASLNMVDLPTIHDALQAESLYRHFQSFEDQRILWKRIVFCHRWVIMGHYCLAILQSGAQLLPQWVLFRLLQYLEQRSLDSSADNRIWLWAVFLGLSEFFAAWLDTQLLWIVDTKLVIPVRSELTSTIFAKVLAKKDLGQAPKVLQSTETGLVMSQGNDSDSTANDEGTDGEGDSADCQEPDQDTINLVSLDTKRITNFAGVSFLVPATISKLGISIAFLLYLIGWESLLAGFAVLFILTPLNIYCSRAMNAAQVKVMRVRDSKNSLVDEVLQGIRQIKFTGTEGYWLQQIHKKREEELRIQWYCFILRAILVGLYQIGPILFSAISLVTYALLKGSLSPSIAFTTIAVFAQVEFSFGVLPKVIVQMLQARISTQRIQRFLESADQARYFSGSQSDSGLSLQNASFAWPTESKKPKSDFCLTDLNIIFPSGKLSVISGDTGSGKSLLLSALVEEVDHLSGTVSLPRTELDSINDSRVENTQHSGSSKAFVSQNAWIENAAIRSNILFGLPFCQGRYDEVIFACALTKDLAMMSDGDATEIGVGGINLSGGQKWRLSFARALYSRASILIIDDIFSAVDAHVGLHLYNYALTGSLAKSRTRIVATHHVQLCLTKAEYHVRLDRGRILEQGSVSANLLDEPVEGSRDIKQGLPVLIGTPIKSDDLGEDTTSELQNGRQLADNPKKFVQEESRPVGSVKFQTYKSYLAATGGTLMFVLVLCAHLSYTGSILGRSWWLSLWTRRTEEPLGDKELPFTTALFRIILRQGHRYDHGLQFSETALDPELKFYLTVYVLISLFVCAATLLKYCSIIAGSIKASRSLFAKFAWTILHAPTHWFDTVPSGRILNRFTADFESIDSFLADGISLLLTIVLQLVSIICAGFLVSPFLVMIAAVLILLSTYVANLFLPAARDVKRLESVARSPVLERFQSTTAGVATIRAYGQAHIHIARMMERLDDCTKTSYYRDLCNVWLTVRLGLVGAIFTAFVAILIVVRRDIDASLAGFALSFALQYTEAVEWTIRLFSSTQLSMNSAERVLEYSNMEIESQYGQPVSAAWPARGQVSIQDLVIRYEAGDTVLKGISMLIEPGERVGIVGRTGAGKSTLSLALFRLLEATSGGILIDGVDIAAIKLEDLRSRMAIISQDPVLFRGTVRSNLDPAKEHSDSELYNALEQVHFTTSVGFEDSSEISDPSGADTPDLLSKTISQGGRNLSQGQRQLLCLARAVISRPKILVMDEATSGIDMKTDAVIQTSIRHCFADSTLIVIAHRLSTLADFDKIFVLDAGKIAEHGSPRDLLLKRSAFWDLVQESGERRTLEERILGSRSGRTE